MGKLISKSPLSGNVFKLSDVNLIVENKPQGEIILDSNGIYPVADYAKANVQVPAGSYDIYVTYNDDGSQSFDIQDATYKPDKLQLRIDATNSCAHMFYSYSGGDEVMVEMLQGLDTSNATSMYYMFYNCENLTSLDLSSFNTSSVTNMNYMFYGCSKLTSLDVSNFDTSNVTMMSYMFSTCNYLSRLDLSNFDTSKVTHMGSMFWRSYILTRLDLSNFDTSNVTNMGSMFSSTGLSEINLSNFDTSNVTQFNAMFMDMRNLLTLDLRSFNTSKGHQFQQMFEGANKLTTIQGTLDLYSATSVGSMFIRTNALTGVTLKNIRKTLLIGSGTQYGHLWELPYLINAVKELWDLTDSDQQTLTIGSANLEKIANVYVKLVDVTDEMLAQDPYAANKLPCIECESTDEGAMPLIAYAGLKN